MIDTKANRATRSDIRPRPKAAGAERRLPPFDDLGPLQRVAVREYAAILAQLADRMTDAADPEREGLQAVFDRILKDSLWAATELRATAEFKYRRQRYISADVYDRWSALRRDGSETLGLYARDANGNSLCHEHVVPRALLREQLSGAGKAADFERLIASATACVVSREEHQHLANAKGLESWHRYLHAKPRVGVYDRAEMRWIVPRSRRPRTP